MIYYNYPSYYFPQNVNSQNRNFKNTRNPNLNTRKNNQGPTQSPAQNPFQNPGQRSVQRPFQSSPQKPIFHDNNNNNNKDNNSKDDKVLFEIFGIKLYSDDILLLCLIFFLYNEGVQDQYLFIALILLLLS